MAENVHNPQVPADAAVQKKKTASATGAKGATGHRAYVKEWPLAVSLVLLLITGIAVYLTDQERVRYANAREELEIKKQLKQTADTIDAEDIAILERAFIPEEDIVDFILTLEQARTAFDSFAINFTSEEPQGKIHSYLTFELSLAGPVSNIEAFLSAVSDSAYVIEITNVEVTSIDGFSGQAHMTMLANMYIAEK